MLTPLRDLAPSGRATQDTIVLPALHSAYADVPTVALTVSALAASALAAHWLNQQPDDATDVYAVRPWGVAVTAAEGHDAEVTAAEGHDMSVRLPLPEPSSPRVYAALLRPWRGWLLAFDARATRRARRRELLLFLGWARAHRLLLPQEVSLSTLHLYAAWLGEQATARQIARATARRRVATARAALMWRAAQVAAYCALRDEFGGLDATA